MNLTGTRAARRVIVIIKTKPVTYSSTHRTSTRYQSVAVYSSQLTPLKEGIIEGTIEGTIEGIIEGTIEGTVEGTVEGTYPRYYLEMNSSQGAPSSSLHRRELAPRADTA